MHLVRAREEAMGQLAANDLARSKYSRDVIPSPASAFKPRQPNANVGAIERHKLVNETRIVGGVLSRMFPWMYQKPADEKGKTKVARMQVQQADAAQKTVQEVKKGNSILGRLLKSWISGVLLWAILKEPLTKFWNDVVKPWWDNPKNPIANFLKGIYTTIADWVTHFLAFFSFAKPTWEGIKDGITGVWDWFKNELPIILSQRFGELGGWFEKLAGWFGKLINNLKLSIANMLLSFTGFLDKIFGGRTLFEVLVDSFQRGITIPLLEVLAGAMTPEIKILGKVVSPRQHVFPKHAKKAADMKKALDDKDKKRKENPDTKWQDWISNTDFFKWLDPGIGPRGGPPGKKGRIFNTPEPLAFPGNPFNPVFPKPLGPYGPSFSPIESHPHWDPIQKKIVPASATGASGPGGAPGPSGAPGMGNIITTSWSGQSPARATPLGNRITGGKSRTDVILDAQTGLLAAIERNTRAGATGAGKQVIVAPGQKSSGGSSEGSNVVTSNIPTQGPPKLDSRGGYVNSTYSINSNSLVT